MEIKDEHDQRGNEGRYSQRIVKECHFHPMSTATEKERSPVSTKMKNKKTSALTPLFKKTKGQLM